MRGPSSGSPPQPQVRVKASGPWGWGCGQGFTSRAGWVSGFPWGMSGMKGEWTTSAPSAWRGARPAGGLRVLALPSLLH